MPAKYSHNLSLTVAWGLALCLVAATGFAPLGYAASARVGSGENMCYQNGEEFFAAQSSASRIVYVCDSEESLRFCRVDQPNEICQRVDISAGLKTLDSRTNKMNAPSRAALAALQQDASVHKRLLAAHLELMKFKGGLVLGQHLSVQTGPYPQITVGVQAMNARCMATIMIAAYRLHQNFPDYNFVVNSQIQNCQNLRDGLKQLLAEKEKVKANLNHFNSPLHSVYLTNRTKFNHFMLGEMGLYVNVDRAGEIKRRLIDFEIGRLAIQHENPPSERVSGLNP